MIKNITLLLILILLLFFDLHWNLSPDNFQVVFWEFRFPRVLGSMLAGMGLAISGLLMQTLFRNPLAGPYLVGVTPGANLGMALMIFVPSSLPLGLTPLTGSILGAFMALMLQISLNQGFGNHLRLLLTGMVLGFVFSAIIEIIQQFGNADQLQKFSFWGMGSFERILTRDLYSLIIPVSLLTAFTAIHSHQLNNYLLGDIYAKSAGIPVERLRKMLIIFGALGSGWITAYCGPIGFVGLVSPHIVKRWINSENHRKLIIPTLLTGAIMCVAADALAHYLIPDRILQVNAICALIGAPILIASFFKRNITPDAHA